MQADTLKDRLPLYVDLDGTLVRTDVAQELLVQAAGKVAHWPKLLTASRAGAAKVKSVCAELAAFDPSTLPYNEAVLDYVRTAKAKGRRVVLATAADQTVATQIAEHLVIFDAVIATSPELNMKGAQKRAAIQQDAGSAEAFEYIGDSAADIPIWAAAQKVGLVNVSAKTKAALGDAKDISFEDRNHRHKRAAPLSAMRPHQWAKNLLVLLPLFMSHGYMNWWPVMQALGAMALFCFCASAIYIVNDLLDIEADRHHPTKCARPFATAALRPLEGLCLSLSLITGTLLISALFFGWKLTSLLTLYIIITTLYTTWLKKKAVMDVIVLTCLYTLRLFIGGVAIGAIVSPWLLNFSLFFFASLALMKRYTELSEFQPDHAAAIRGYYASDTLVLLAMGLSTGGLSVITLTLYLNSPFVADAYHLPELLWFIAPLTLFWIFRAWLLATRNHIHEDPVVFALTDRTSRITVLLMIALVISAKFLVI